MQGPAARVIGVLVGLLPLLLVGCSGAVRAPAGATAPPTLYEDLGGATGVLALTEQFLMNIADDRRVNQHFVETNVVRFRDKLAEHLCQIADGPCTYSGDSMRDTHAGMNIDLADFYAVVDDLVAAMDSLRLPTATQNRLLARLAPLHADIITR